MSYRGRDDAIVLGLPRGGVVVAAEVAQRLGVPLDAFVVRKLGVPGHEELAMGALAAGGVRVINDDVVNAHGITPSQLSAVTEREQSELDRREESYRSGRPHVDVADRTAIVVDDGLATGSTMKAAVAALRSQRPAKLVAAVPVAAPSVGREIDRQVDEFICPLQPPSFYAVGLWYDDFSPTSDAEVRALLGAAGD